MKRGKKGKRMGGGGGWWWKGRGMRDRKGKRRAPCMWTGRVCFGEGMEIAVDMKT